jgi:hypothetical protein
MNRALRQRTRLAGRKAYPRHDGSAAARLDLGPSPRGEATITLAGAARPGTPPRDRVDALDRDRREATQPAASASEALAQLERRSLAGADVATQRKKLETELAKARATAAEPWPSDVPVGRRLSATTSSR